MPKRKRHRPRWIGVIARVLTVYLAEEVDQHDLDVVFDQGSQYAVRYRSKRGDLEFLVDLTLYNAGMDEGMVADECVQEVEFTQWPPVQHSERGGGR